MNEVNINASTDSFIVLFFNECPMQGLLLQRIYVAKECIKDITEIDYSIYSYDSQKGRLNKIFLTYDSDILLVAIIDNLLLAMLH